MLGFGYPGQKYPGQAGPHGASVTSTPGTGSLTLTCYAPVVSAPRVCVPATQALTLTGYAPTVTTPRVSVPAPVSLSTTAYAPTVLAPRTVVPSTASLALTAYAPVVSTPRSVVPATASLTLTGYAPVVSAPRVIVPATAALTLATFAPDVTVAAGITSTPATGSLTLTTYAPTVSTPRLTVPGVAALTLITYAPDVYVEPVPTPTDQLLRGAPGLVRKRRIGIREGHGRGLVPTFAASLLVGEAAISSTLNVVVEGTGNLILDTRYDIATTAVAVLVGEQATQGAMPFAVQVQATILGSPVRGVRAGMFRTGAEAVLTGEQLVWEMPAVRAVTATTLVAEGMLSAGVPLFPFASGTMRHEYAIGGRMPVRTGGEAAATGFEPSEMEDLLVLGLPSELG